MRSVTDPFLLSGYDDDRAARRPSRNDELARRSGLPRNLLDDMPPDALRVVEDCVARVEAWADLSAAIHRTLENAGFHQHDLRGEGGGFHIASHVRDDGVLVSWEARQYAPTDGPGSFSYKVERVMRPALREILAASGFEAQPVPEDEDNAGYILVTGLADAR